MFVQSVFVAMLLAQLCSSPFCVLIQICVFSFPLGVFPNLYFFQLLGFFPICVYCNDAQLFSSPVFSPFCVFLQSVFFKLSGFFFQSVFFCNVACSTFQLPCCGQLDKKGEARFVQGICSRSTLTSVFYLAHLYHPHHLSQHWHCDNVFLCLCAHSCRSSKNMFAAMQK